MNNSNLDHFIDFRRAFIGSNSATERGELCKDYMPHLLPADPAARACVRWSALNLSSSGSLHIGLIETTDKPGARLMLIHAKRLISTSRHADEAEARHAAFLFDWKVVRE